MSKFTLAFGKIQQTTEPLEPEIQDIVPDNVTSFDIIDVSSSQTYLKGTYNVVDALATGTARSWRHNSNDKIVLKYDVNAWRLYDMDGILALATGDDNPFTSTSWDNWGFMTTVTFDNFR